MSTDLAREWHMSMSDVHKSVCGWCKQSAAAQEARAWHQRMAASSGSHREVCACCRGDSGPGPGLWQAPWPPAPPQTAEEEEGGERTGWSPRCIRLDAPPCCAVQPREITVRKDVSDAARTWHAQAGTLHSENCSFCKEQRAAQNAREWHARAASSGGPHRNVCSCCRGDLECVWQAPWPLHSVRCRQQERPILAASKPSRSPRSTLVGIPSAASSSSSTAVDAYPTAKETCVDTEKNLDLDRVEKWLAVQDVDNNLDLDQLESELSDIAADLTTPRT
mmetsp:Transcript_30805/g.100308  ORF Transcript_30805/g.100308 Transcript_30805/m.100308 type:complete len:278 (-) Transcript_30805:45-878(-)